MSWLLEVEGKSLLRVCKRWLGGEESSVECGCLVIEPVWMVKYARPCLSMLVHACPTHDYYPPSVHITPTQRSDLSPLHPLYQHSQSSSRRLSTRDDSGEVRRGTARPSEKGRLANDEVGRRLDTELGSDKGGRGSGGDEE